MHTCVTNSRIRQAAVAGNKFMTRIPREHPNTERCLSAYSAAPQLIHKTKQTAAGQKTSQRQPAALPTIHPACKNANSWQRREWTRSSV